MIEPLEISESISKNQLYSLLQRQAVSLFDGETDIIANMANFSSLLYHNLPSVNWVGFYIFKKNELVLGPFQGSPACVRLQLGKGVCGTSALTRTSLIVPNVHLFDGHIACDSASNSEIVIPLIKDDVLFGVLDIDSPVFNRFDEIDCSELEELTSLLLKSSVL